MLIRVALLHREEGLFNADCSVSLLLDAIKKRHHLAREADPIDLCSVDGTVKHLSSHLHDSGGSFFELREQCIVISIVSTEDGNSTYVPVLEEYSKNEDFMAALSGGQESSDRIKSHKRSGHHRQTGNSNKSPTPDSGKNKNTKGKRRASILK